MRKRVLCHIRTTNAQISAFVVRCLDSVMSLASVTKTLSLMLASVAELASLSLTRSETPQDSFSHDEAHAVSLTNFQNGLTPNEYKKDVCGSQKFTRLQRELREFDLNVYLSETDFETTFRRAISVKTDMLTIFFTILSLTILSYPWQETVTRSTH